MIELSEYGQKVVNNFNFIGMWIAALICCRNFSVCLQQYKRTRGKIHLVNLAQVSVLFIHRVLYGIIPLFEIKTCAYFPLLVSLWHITYILFYIVMFMRLIILELDRYSRWIKTVGVLLITLRFADWPYELAFHSIQQRLMDQTPHSGSQCWAEWGAGVIILNFVGDALANLFLSGMFVRRLFIHINMSKSLMSHQNKVIERIARKSLICLAFTFVVNLAMNLLKVTMFLGDHSDAFTVYFQIIESTLLVEALRNDGNHGESHHSAYCESCGKELSLNTGRSPNNDEQYHSQMLVKSFHSNSDKNKHLSTYTDDTYDHKHPSHSLASLEPAVLLEANHHGSFSNSMRFHSGPSISSMQNRNTGTTLIDSPLPSPGVGHSFSKDTYMMMDASLDRTSSPRISPSVSSTPTGNASDSKTSYWRDDK